jgi:hypothetical protein
MSTTITYKDRAKLADFPPGSVILIQNLISAQRTSLSTGEWSGWVPSGTRNHFDPTINIQELFPVTVIYEETRNWHALVDKNLETGEVPSYD